jgi:hypothetical protein
VVVTRVLISGGLGAAVERELAHERRSGEGSGRGEQPAAGQARFRHD